MNVSHQPELSTWNAATRSMEVVDAVELSLEKGRTLDVHQQELTERLAFRGTMAAMGCGLLMVGFFVFIIVSLFGAAEGEQRTKLISSWPAILLAVLAFFLLLQCAPLLVRRAKPSAERDSRNR
jgi:H+/Cl- antiporter ClcA